MAGKNSAKKVAKGETRESRNVAQSFEDVNVYQRARELTNEVYTLTRREAWRRDRGLSEQMRRAAVSIMSNIAEGFERGEKSEFVQFLYIAKGSSGEVRAQLQVACDQNYISQDDYRRLEDRVRRVSGMLANFISHLQQTSYRGEKYTRTRRRAKDAQQKRIDALRAAQEASMAASQRPDKATPLEGP